MQAQNTPAHEKPGPVTLPQHSKTNDLPGAGGWLRSVSNFPDQPLPKSRKRLVRNNNYTPPPTQKQKIRIKVKVKVKVKVRIKVKVKVAAAVVFLRFTESPDTASGRFP